MEGGRGVWRAKIRLQLQLLHHLLHLVRVRVQIPGRRRNVGVTQNVAQRRQVAALLQEAGGKSVAQRVRRHVLLDPRSLCRALDHLLHGA